MDKIVRFFVVIACSILHCKGVDFREQLEEYLDRTEDNADNNYELRPSRRFKFDLDQMGSIIGAPSMASHLPEAEPILPGHTLIRPALGMLKSAIKFPHLDLENGAGVYGNVNNLGIRYDGRNERVLYSGFRRSPMNYIVVAPVKSKSSQPKYVLSTVVLDKENKQKVYDQLLKNIRNIQKDKGIKKKRNPPPKLKMYGDKENATPKKILRIIKSDLRQDYASSDYEVIEKEPDLMNNYDFKPEEEIDNAKNKWFWNAKESYNHVKINQEAPDQAKLMPTNVSKNIRSWWFYHQDDYQPFDENDL